MGLLGFTNREIQVVGLRVNGADTAEVMRRLGIKRQRAYDYLWIAKRKAGVDSLEELRRWAVKWGFDTPLEPETSETRPYPGKPKRGPYRRTRWPLQDARREP
jgi:DNA-binding CsgD family transcriptional regulator